MAGLALAALAAAIAAGSSSRGTVHGRYAAARDVSANWSGYAVTGPGSTPTTASSATTFTNVTATWTVPKAVCTPGASSAAALWVGLGGYTIGSKQLEQAGTDSDCGPTGVDSYYAWYELVPEPSVTVRLKIRPGDLVTSSVLVNGSDVLVQVKDRTRRTVFTKHLQAAAPDLTSAEWIAEAPSECSGVGFCRVVQLTNFGSVTFTRIAALGNGEGGTISTNPGWVATPIQLVPQARRFLGERGPDRGGAGAGATPAGLSADGTSFTVNYTPNAAVTTTTTTTPSAPPPPAVPAG